jgi:uncharacterized protein YggE
MNRFLIPLPVIVALLSGAPVAAQSSASQPPSRTITVSAGVDVPAVPDRAVVQLGVQTRASNAQTAMAQNNTVMTQVITALKGLGIPDNQIQTSSLSLSPVYSNPPPQNPPVEPQLIGFDAANTVTVELSTLTSDLTKLGPAIDAAVAAGANQIQSISFSVADDERYRLTALQQAGALAKAKAQALATGLGVTLGDVDAAVEGNFQATPIYNGGVSAPSASPAVPVLPGQILLHTDVQVRFTLK